MQRYGLLLCYKLKTYVHNKACNKLSKQAKTISIILVMFIDVILDDDIAISIRIFSSEQSTYFISILVGKTTVKCVLMRERV